MDLENIKVSATVIVISKDNKALIVQRPPDKAFPNLWTVAGGKLQDTDGYTLPNDKGFRYESLESCARRELLEETGIKLGIEKLQYLTSITTIWGDTRRVIVSFYVFLGQDSQDIKINLSECQDYRWIPEYLIDSYNFIPNIGEEIHEVFKLKRGY
jgi:8-oxo-dGTP pyrophosphatase MutT (NUDIX family)